MAGTACRIPGAPQSSPPASRPRRSPATGPRTPSARQTAIETTKPPPGIRLFHNVLRGREEKKNGPAGLQTLSADHLSVDFASIFRVRCGSVFYELNSAQTGA